MRIPKVLLLLATLTIAASSLAATRFDLVETTPVETTLDHSDIPAAIDVWLEMIRGARQTLDIESFYFSDDPDDDDDPLDRVLSEVEAAAARGVQVRMIGDKGFHRTYPEILDRLGALPNIETRLLDARSLWGGVQHAKFMIVDGRDAYLGSQNWDWRALMHIRELGVRTNNHRIGPDISRVFEMDWALAGGEDLPTADPKTNLPSPFSTDYSEFTSYGEHCRAILAGSPPQALPHGIPHDEPLLIDLMDRAERTLELHLLSYNPGDRDGGYYGDLDQALRRAAARGVEVRIILSNWAKRSYMLPHVKSLAVLDNIEVRFTNIPEWSGGFVPFARVEHPKYLVRDGEEAWLGTSNWSRSYFTDSRNLSLFIKCVNQAWRMHQVFEMSWKSKHAETVDPGKSYTPPRRKE